jgi:uncharacterized protein with HEPN domain
LKNEENEDFRALKDTLSYCEDIELTLNRFGKDYDIFIHDRVFFHALSMSLMQVGEMSNKLSEAFKQKMDGHVDWRRLKYIRNLFAHAYSNIDERTIWEFATVFIPVYREFCRQEIRKFTKNK